ESAWRSHASRSLVDSAIAPVDLRYSSCNTVSIARARFLRAARSWFITCAPYGQFFFFRFSFFDRPGPISGACVDGGAADRLGPAAVPTSPVDQDRGAGVRGKPLCG